ncbi:MAG: hypothetical protein KGH59_02540 [Candidatus Micrarchaeota archaeon]|nr:hypothetical protein [Candidatus Micrarchaeota archaeon]MDE1804635.1 hypothetical protein [Candidatus Micrarchaeota archaeon]MDE1846787.1 hypothetical protein [Candidatus Micrarchaeota archaeon]
MLNYDGVKAQPAERATGKGSIVADIDKDFAANRMELLRGFNAKENVSPLFNNFILSKRDSHSPNTGEMLSQLLVFEKITSYISSVKGRFEYLRVLAQDLEVSAKVAGINSVHGSSFTTLSYLMFFNPKTSDDLFLVAPLAMAAIIPNHVENYYNTDSAKIGEDRKLLWEILTEDFNIKEKSAKTIVSKAYGYVTKAIMIKGFFRMIGNGEGINEESFANSYLKALYAQEKIVGEMQNKLDRILRDLGVKMSEQRMLDKFRILKRSS